MPLSVSAQLDVDRPRLFKAYNPDGDKYRYVKDYLISLRYLKTISQTNEDINKELQEKERLDQVEILREQLIQNNVQLRVARNFLNRNNKNRSNGLILLATEQFEMVCNQMIELNNRERARVERYYQALSLEEGSRFDLEGFNAYRESIQRERKEVSKLLFETSALVGKILISNQENYFGEFDRLGITQEQRYKLLSELDKFKGVDFDREVRAGQTFLEASLSAIREVLEDYRYSSLDG